MESIKTIQQKFTLSTGPTSFDQFAALTVRLSWLKKPDADSKIVDLAGDYFNKNGSVFTDELIKVMRVGDFEMVLVDLRVLPKESRHKIARAIEYPMPIEHTEINDFTNLQTKAPYLFPNAAEHLPKAIVFYCRQGTNRSPGMALYYTNWLFQQMYKWDKNRKPDAPLPCHVCVLQGGFDAFEKLKPGLTIKECLMLVEEYRQADKTTDVVDAHEPRITTNMRCLPKKKPMGST